MHKVKIVIEKSIDMFSAYAENIEGVYGAGDTVEEAKDSILSAIRILKAYNTEDNIPKILKGEYKIEYKFDTESLLNYYKKLFTKSGLEKITGINQKQLQHYSTGLKKPRQAQTKKLETALHKLGHELLSVHL
ncbi:type II toxin-antitoxin system HicB family antitoxin [Chitinophagaceae bacterium LWZ2-11]